MVALLLACALASGCISLARIRTGVAPGRSEVLALQKGAGLHEVLSICGVPQETLVQPDGLLLIYRERQFDFRRVGFEPAGALSAVDISGLISTALSNLKLVLQWGDFSERRLVVLFGQDERLLAYAFRDGAGKR